MARNEVIRKGHQARENKDILFLHNLSGMLQLSLDSTKPPVSRTSLFLGVLWLDLILMLLIASRFFLYPPSSPPSVPILGINKFQTIFNVTVNGSKDYWCLFNCIFLKVFYECLLRLSFSVKVVNGSHHLGRPW